MQSECGLLSVRRTASVLYFQEVVYNHRISSEESCYDIRQHLMIRLQLELRVARTEDGGNDDSKEKQRHGQCSPLSRHAAGNIRRQR